MDSRAGDGVFAEDGPPKERLDVREIPSALTALHVEPSAGLFQGQGVGMLPEGDCRPPVYVDERY